MSSILETVPFTGGIDRSVASIHANKSTFWDLVGLRQSPVQQGLIEQVPYFYLQNTFTQGTYYLGANQTELTTSPVYGILRYRTGGNAVNFYVTKYTIRDGSFNQMQVFFQTAPVTVSINTHCHLVINNVAGLAITLGNTLDVVIDGATTFKYRKNGGAYTTLVPITTAGVSIDGGNATLYFLTAVGFSINDTWSWQRNDAAGAAGNTGVRAVPYVQYNDELFFILPTYQVMSYQVSGCVVSAGYRPVFAAYLTIYENHLILISGGTTNTAPNNYPGTLTILNSDLNDLHCFWSTDVNEADSNTLPVGEPNAANGNNCYGGFVFNQQLYILTGNGLYYTTYLGLPTVFSFHYLTDCPCNFSANSLFPIVRGTNGIYIITDQGPYLFNGFICQYIGRPIRSFLVTTTSRIPPLLSTLLTVYNSITRELYWYIGTAYIYVYQEMTNTFYRRYFSFSTTVTSLGISTDPSNGYLLVGCASRRCLCEDGGYAQTPVSDASSGASFGLPTLITQAVDNEPIENTKETSSVYLSAAVTTVGGVYSAPLVALGWYLSDIGVPVAASVDSNPTWTSANTDGRLSMPRVAYKVLNLRLFVQNITSGQPAGLTIGGLSTNLPTQKAKR